ncbi:MAG: response regulator [Microcoleaceae cyanobacterium]|jgi:signal transduction histidine kinase
MKNEDTFNKPKNSSIADILVVDDTPDNLRLLSDLLTNNGYKVRNVTNGKMALDAAQLKPPDLILLDIMMPGIDGYEVCRQLKLKKETSLVPIIFLSAKNEVEDKVQGFGLGGVDYITKPYQAPEVLARIENQLRISDLQKTLRKKNQQLQQEIHDRVVAEEQLKLLNQKLEKIVEARTLQLQTQNQELLFLKDQLQKKLEEEHSLSDLKSELITTISHQFRTPLTIISTSSDLIKRKLMKVEMTGCERYFQRINDSVQKITFMLEDTLTLAKASSEELQLNIIPINLTELCQSLIENWHIPENNSSKLSFVSVEKSSDTIKGDANLIQKMLSHIVANAIGFSPNGGNIVLELTYQPQNAIVRITDEGIGIPPEEKTKVFERFYRASNANSVPGTPGAGLGLAVVQWIVQQHHGTITIESILNKGTTVTLSLPL